MLVSRFPYPLDKGDKLRAYHQLTELKKHFDITLIALHDRPISADQLKEVKKHCDRIICHKIHLFSKLFHMLRCVFNRLPFQVGYFYSFRIQRQIRQSIQREKYDQIYCQLIRTTEYVKNIHHIPKTLDYMDTLSMGMKRRIEKQSIFTRWIFRSEAKRLATYERRIFDYFEHTTIISEQDKQFIQHPEREAIVCIPNGISSHFFQEKQTVAEYDFVFVGNMSYPPNIDAVQYIAVQLLPAFSKAKLLVSGASPHPSVQQLCAHHAQIELTGWVDDIRESYAKGKIFLAPMMIGTGMQNKLLEAMAMGIPCITSSLANNAINAKHGSEILVANTPEEFIQAIHKLNEDPMLYAQLSTNAREFVRKKFSWEKSVVKLAALMKSGSTS